MNWKFDIVELALAVIISFLLGAFYVLTGVGSPLSAPVLSEPDLPTSFSSHPSSGASTKAGLLAQGQRQESGFVPAIFDINAGETNTSHSTENQQSLSGHLIRNIKVTAYCPCELCCGKWSDGYTASGHKIGKDDKFVAAPLSIPFGMMLVVPGYNDGKPVPVLDRGGAIRGNRLDVFFDSHKEALEWGVKWL